MQESLLDLCDSPALGLSGSVQRVPLTRGAWVDLRPGWLAGAGAVFDRLLDAVPWRAEQRKMYDRVVDVPRLLCFYSEDAVLPDPVLDTARDALSRHYAAELGEPFRTAGLCLYRDGRDSVAWHGDTIRARSTQDTVVAIVSLGTPRPPAAPAARRRRRCVRYDPRPRRPARHGWELPADLGTRGAEGGRVAGPANQRAVPPAGVR